MINRIAGLLSIMSLFFLASCGDNATTTDANSVKEDVLVEDVVIEEIPTLSELDFDVALAAFENKEYEKSARFLDLVIKDIEYESKLTDKGAKEQIDLSVYALKHLSEQIRKGEIKDIATLEIAFSEAEMLTAHNYLVFSEMYVDSNPQKALSFTKRAVNKVESAIKKMEGQAKAEAIVIANDLKKADKKADDIGSAAGHKLEGLAAWITKHKKTLK